MGPQSRFKPDGESITLFSYGCVIFYKLIGRELQQLQVKRFPGDGIFDKLQVQGQEQ